MDNKARILECALELFCAKGYDAVGVQEIAEKAGITKPTLYYYFGSKYGLLEALFHTYFSDISARLSEASAYNGDVGETLYHMASVYLDFAKNHYKVYTLFMALFYSAKENEAYQAVQPFAQKFYRLIVDFFERASHELGNMNGRQEQFAIGFIGLINHYILFLDDGKGEMKEVSEQQKRALIQQFLYGIYS